MADIDELVRRAVLTVTSITDRAAKFSTKVLLVVTLICVGGFALGVAALSDGIEQVWIVLGIVFGALAIGSAFVARWRVGAVRRHVPELADEVRTLVTEDPERGRTVIESFVVDDGTSSDPAADGERGGGQGSAIVMSRQMGGFRSVIVPGTTQPVRLTAAVRALTSFPLLMLVALMITFVFGFLSFFFLIALAL